MNAVVSARLWSQAQPLSQTSFTRFLKSRGLVKRQFGVPFPMPQPSSKFSSMTSLSRFQANPEPQSSIKQLQQEWDSNTIVPSPPYVDPRISHAYGRSIKELRYTTLAPLIDSMCQREPHSTAVLVYDEGICKSFEQLNADINQVVNGMVEKLNLRVGDRVHEFSHVIKQSNIKVLFMPGRNSKQSSLNYHTTIIGDPELGKLQDQGELGSFKEIVLLDGELEESDLSMKGIKVSRWRSLVSNNHVLTKEAQARVNEVSSDDLYCVYYTSGTTGTPKGAAITQFNAINNVTFSISRIFRERGPKFKSIRPNICIPLPLFHGFAGILGSLMPFTYGGSFVLPGMRYSIESVVESIQRFKCNSIYLTPTILIDMLGYIEQHKIIKLPLKIILIAGSPVMPELVHKCRKVLTDLEEFRIAYGSSENGVIASMQTSEEPDETQPFTVGPPLDLTEMRVVDPVTGMATSLGQSGEVQTRGFNTMAGYINDPARTREVITPARWYRTGDLGIIDKQGRLQIVGRIKDMIIKGGENIYPAEIETILHAHPDIHDAHVFGIPDQRRGEEICTWIMLKEPSRAKPEDQLKADITEFCKTRITYFKVPKHIFFVTEFPTTPLKKIKKFEMRAQTIELLGLNKET